ncbi:MAG TPA: ATP-binding protein, partial [Verrucomicrobiae bacterium]|nr:ATP-binding protein [Verrucomicrobiae bacterium]
NPAGPPPAGGELGRQLMRLMVGRAAVLTLLLGGGILVERILPRSAVRVPYFYALTGAGYCLTILYAVFHRWWADRPMAAYSQLVGDLVLVTGLVYATGGIDSPFSVLYFTVIIASSILLRRRGAFVTAAASWLLYTFLVLLIVYRFVPLGPGGRANDLTQDVSALQQIVYSLFAHALAFLAVAFLSSALAEKVYTTGRELREREEDLARLQALSKNIVDSITSGVLTTDLTGTITFVNRGGEEIFGKPVAWFIGRGVWEVLGQAPDFLTQVSDGLGRDRRRRIEARVGGPKGQLISLGITTSLLKDQRGTPNGFIFAFMDLTDIKALEEEIRVKDRMAALGGMAAGMAHEIRNPLASMSGSVQLLKRTIRPAPQEAELFDIVVREGKRLDRIISDFLLFARPGRFDAADADIVPILRESLLLIRHGDEFGANHEILSDLPDEGVVARVDVNLIRQVFWNLAKNALRAMPQGGKLAVAAGLSGAGAALVTFTDEGIGMTEEEIDAAFQPFRGSFRGGIGLGLAVVFRVVQEHGGKIRVQSRPGTGSTFTIELPGARKPLAVPAVRNEVAAGRSGEER